MIGKRIALLFALMVVILIGTPLQFLVGTVEAAKHARLWLLIEINSFKRYWKGIKP